jgi:hypothetical protein
MKDFAQYGYHNVKDVEVAWPLYKYRKDTKFTYDFRNFFHPYVGELLEALNKRSLEGMLDPATQSLAEDFFASAYKVHDSDVVGVEYHPKDIDVEEGGPYANYNWELFFHIPLTVAVHLSKTQRFAEAERWFHFIFDPRATDESLDPPQRYWKFLRFRRKEDTYQVAQLLEILSIPDSEATEEQLELKARVLEGYEAIKHHPFQPHAVARTRPLAYQYQVVMKYLDNLIAWGDSLFAQDTIESINEATQRYVLAANLLGPRPQQVPALGTVQPQTFAQLVEHGLDPTGNALVELEGQFPLNLAPQGEAEGSEAAQALFGIGRALYFCVPNNDRLLSYWDTVADRLYKIRHCMNIEGVVRQLALFDPPLDPGMLVKAAAAGIDIGSIVAGTSQPVGPLRAIPQIQKALELAGEVRSFGGALLTAIEKEEAEQLALMRQGHEIKVQKLAQDVRFLQWKNAEEATESLLAARATAWERYRYYLRLQGLAPDDEAAPEMPSLERPELSEENFDEVFEDLVGKYETAVAGQPFPKLNLSGNSSPSNQSGASGAGAMYLTTNEDAELNTHMPAARDFRIASSTTDAVAGVLAFIPDFNVDLHYWGLGASSFVFGGTKLSAAAKIGAEVLRTIATYHADEGGIAGRTAGHERRADEWILQANLAARELAHSGRQIISSLIAEQIAHHEYLNVKTQIADSEEIDAFLHSKFSNEELHAWMQGEISRLFYEWYRFAFDTARKAERTMKLELRRPELDASEFVKFNYWDGGRKGLLSGEALHLDVKRMEMAYHDNNKRELELTRHVSLRQLDPLALLRLKATGTATFAVPEWLYDRDYPGHYMRRIKSVAVSVPSVVGPYTPVPCTLSLQRSTTRVSPLLADGAYGRGGPEDERFVDAYGPVESIVTSSGTNDSGLFETNLRDERFLPFECAGAESTWQADLPADLRGFDYATVSDLILHIRYTARQGGDLLGDAAIAELKEALGEAQTSGLALLFSLRHDFPDAWSQFASGSEDLQLELTKSLFPYMVQDRELVFGPSLELYAGETQLAMRTVPAPASLGEGLNEPQQQALLGIAPDATVLKRDRADAFLVIPYGFEDS